MGKENGVLTLCLLQKYGFCLLFFQYSRIR